MAARHLYSCDRQPDACPACGSANVVSILYGPPSAELKEDLERGDLVFGGCCLSDDDPCWQCGDCGTQIYPEGEALDEECVPGD